MPGANSGPATTPVDAAAEAFLLGRFGHDVRDVAPIGYGEWSRAYGFRHRGDDLVVRFGQYAEDFEKDRRAADYRSGALPVPLVTEIGEAYGGHYAISARAYGGFIDELDGDRMRSVLPSLLAALDAMRSVSLADSTGFGGWGADGTAPHPTWRAALHDVDSTATNDRLPDWRERLARSPTGIGPFEEALDGFRMLLPFCPDDRHLIHSDLLHFNVLVADDDRISAIVDWGCAMYGDFLYDVAWFVFWAPWYPAWAGIDFRAEALRHYERTGLDVPHFEERLRCYQLHMGLDSLKYNAAMGRPDGLATVARRTLAVARGET
jgi:hygromycin-B 4-O-kinase